jgi:rRNA-processing protein FCF1
MGPHPRHRRSQLEIILDTNALFVPLQFRIDIQESLKALLNTNFKLILPLPVKAELERLADKGSPKIRRDATYALETLIKIGQFEIDENYAELPPDDAVLRTAQSRRALVFTNDRVLRRRLRDINVPVIYVRQKSRLEVDGKV